MAATRETLADISPGYRPWWRRAGYRLLGHHRLLLAASSALAVAQRLRLIPPRVRRRTGLPSRLPVRRAALRPTDADDTTREPVWLFTGCVMDAWQRDVHAAVQRVLEAAGAAVTPSAGGASCCGALAEHAGLGDQARSLAARVIRSFPPDAAVLVDSAGCGAMLKDYGHLLGTPEGERFAARVFDVHEWLADPRHPQRLERLASRLDAGGGQPVVAVQDPCHLRHVQRAHLPVRAVLGLVADVRELDDDALCCGAGGAYAVLHPEESARIRDRKLAAIARTGAPLVATANPGCQLHLQAGGLDAHHPLVYVDAALAARRPDRGR